MGFKKRKKWSVTGWLPRSERTMKAIVATGGMSDDPGLDLVYMEKEDAMLDGHGDRVRRVRVTTTIEIEEIDG